MPAYELDTSILDQIIANSPETLDSWLRGVAQQMTNEIVLSFGTGPGGVTYDNHVASSPGFPPNIDTGALRASMHWNKEGSLEYQISDGVEYGIYMEEGTEYIAARPFVQPVFNSWQGGKLERDAAQAGLFEP